MSGREHPDSGIDVAELSRLWADGVVPISEALISEEMPAETRAFLTGFGLPTRETYVVEFYHDERLTKPYVRGGRSYFPIGDDGTAVYAVESQTGEVYDLYPRRDHVSCFVNSDVGWFVFFVGRYLQAQPGLLDNLPEQDEPGPRYQADLLALREELARCDPRAFSDNACWWARRFAEAKVGDL